MTKPYGLTVRAIIKNEKDELLILKRHPLSRTDPLKWELPGGKVEPGEDFDKAIIREVKEETSLDGELGQLFEAVYDESPHKRTVQVIMNIENVTGDVEISDEHVDWMWADLNKIRTLELSRVLNKVLDKKNWEI